jgi:hypothetical protein
MPEESGSGGRLTIDVSLSLQPHDVRQKNATTRARRRGASDAACGLRSKNGIRLPYCGHKVKARRACAAARENADGKGVFPHIRPPGMFAKRWEAVDYRLIMLIIVDAAFSIPWPPP